MKTGDGKQDRNYLYIGKGLYTVPEASRLTGINSRSIARWIHGYANNREHRQLNSPPIFRADYEKEESGISLSFRDLIEIRFVYAFRKHGVSWKSVRIASKRAADFLKSDHPFSMRKFCTDKKSILTRIADEAGDIELLNLVNQQYEIDKILEPYLYEALDFTDLDEAIRWWPRGKQHRIVLDPLRSFGKPIINSYNVPTAIIADCFKRNRSISTVAEWYEIDPQSVEEAIQFENSLAA